MTTGLVIAVYILVMGRLNVDRRIEDPVKTQAVLIANHIISLTEPHEGFGHVSLCDSSSDRQLDFDNQGHKITSLNAAKATLHSAAAIAKGLGSKFQEEHVLADLSSLEQLQQRLVEKVFQEVAPPPGGQADPALSNNLYTRVLKTLKDKDPTDLKTVAMTVRLGKYNDNKLMTTIAHPASEANQPYVENGLFKPDFPVPVAGERVVRFMPYAGQVSVVEAGPFIEAAPGALPNAVLVEVQYEPRGKSQTAVHIVRRVCVLLGGSAPKPMPSCFLFRFPQGLAETFAKPAALLSESIWTKTGQWQQASGGRVPGSGTLKLTIDPVLPAMRPGDALALSIYHWIRHLRPAPDPQAVLTALNQNFPLLEPKSTNNGDENTAPVNSCLVADTGAREHSFAKNTEAKSESQKAIEQCFEYPGRLEEYPQSAMPLYVDRTGNLNLAGRSGFDTDLVGEYLNAVYATNLSALESTNTAKLVRKQSALENRELELKMSIKRQELAGLSKARATILVQQHGIKSGAADQELTKQLRDTEARIETLKASLIGIENRKAQLRIVNELTRVAMLNADRATARTYELCSTTFTMLRNGLHSFDLPNHGFLIGRKMVFLPLSEPVKESQFFEAAGWAMTNQYFDHSKISPWFQKQLPILISVRDIIGSSGLTINQKPLTEILSEVELTNSMPPLTVLIDSRELQYADRAKLHSSSEYPFQGTPVSEDQGFYYAKSATTTGAGKDVVWSVVARDLVFHEHGKGRIIAGPTNTGWEKRMIPPIDGPCGLAAEFQIRRPLPRLEGMPAGAYITDPNKRLMTPQIPPVPVELM